MKKTIATLSLMILSVGLSYSQCQPLSCEHIEDHSGILINTSFNSSVCFATSSTLTIASSVNWNNWEYLSFSGEIVVNQNINFGTTNDKVYASGEVYFNYLSMNGSDTLFTDGNAEIGTLISNNSFGTTWNYIITPSTIQVGSTYYYPGDTIITGGGTGNDVVVLQCTETPLSINLISFTYQNNQLQWEVNSDNLKTKIVVQQSNDSKQWTDIYTSFLNKDYYNINQKDQQYFRLQLSDEQKTKYSKIIRVGQTTKTNYQCYDLSGKKMDEDQIRGLYIRVYEDYRIEKVYKQ